MNVMRPKLFVIDGRQYRFNSVDDCPNNENEILAVKNEHPPAYVERDGETVFDYALYFLIKMYVDPSNTCILINEFINS